MGTSSRGSEKRSSSRTGSYGEDDTLKGAKEDADNTSADEEDEPSPDVSSGKSSSSKSVENTLQFQPQPADESTGATTASDDADDAPWKSRHTGSSSHTGGESRGSKSSK